MGDETVEFTPEFAEQNKDKISKYATEELGLKGQEVIDAAINKRFGELKATTEKEKAALQTEVDTLKQADAERLAKDDDKKTDIQKMQDKLDAQGKAHTTLLERIEKSDKTAKEATLDKTILEKLGDAVNPEIMQLIIRESVKHDEKGEVYHVNKAGAACSLDDVITEQKTLYPNQFKANTTPGGGNFKGAGIKEGYNTLAELKVDMPKFLAEGKKADYDKLFGELAAKNAQDTVTKAST